MLWLGICLARLPLEVFLRGECRSESTEPADSFAPIAVCENGHVLLASPAAETLGVVSGIRRTTALALAPTLHIRERAFERERETLTQIACWALQFTPSVSLVDPGVSATTSPALARPRGDRPYGLMMEIEPSLRLFGGIDTLLARLREGLRQLGVEASIGQASTATAAWLLARHRDGARLGDGQRLVQGIAALPAGLLDEALTHRETLQSIGLRTIGDLMRLPRAGVARRFGKRLLDEIDRAQGHQADPRPWFEAPRSFHARLELLARVEDAQALLCVARRLLWQLTGWLDALHRGTREVLLLAEHDDHPATMMSIQLAETTRDPERLSALLRERLASTRLPAPTETLHLRCEQTVPLTPDSEELFPSVRAARDSIGALIDRLRTRLGREQVQSLLLAEDHRPEAAYRIEALAALPDSAPTPSGNTPTMPRRTLPRPLWLLSRPVALSERNHRPYWQGPLALLAGPERIETGWWDGRLVQRDYFIAEDEAHALYWVFRERLPDTESGQGWFVQGRFG